MSNTITIDPVTRLEGHLAVKVELENGRVSQAYSMGEMFRGFEVLLRGRDPLDAQQITQRICGVCPISHGIASILAQDDAYKITPPENGRILRNLIQAANFIQSHIVHFYVLSALDFVDIAAILKYKGDNPALTDLRDWVSRQVSSKQVFPAAPFLPRYEGKYLDNGEANFRAIGNYLQSLEMRRIGHQMVALFAGKVPHAPGLIPGGVTEQVTARSVVYYQSKLDKLRQFIDNAYIPDVLAVATSFPDYFETGKGCGNYLAYGVFPESNTPGDQFLPGGIHMDGKLHPLDAGKITEQVKYSWFTDRTTKLHPAKGSTVPQPGKDGAYSWLKAPRYDGKVMEVGPLARIMILYSQGKNPELNRMVDHLLSVTGKKPEHLNSVLGRHATRALECKLIADRCAVWLKQLKPGEATFKDFTIPQSAMGMGLTEASRGALGHWIHVENQKIANYQCVVPTTWNCSPRDDAGVMGALEQAIAGTQVADANNPLEVTRVVRSFDPCLACAVH
ncbi:MAG: nickel-dependent hydrogenase large subunit [Magnetococcales bacterium]|nr:nickel-dependent hydrogenase large subunit [Magnetococcales bacterium]